MIEVTRLELTLEPIIQALSPEALQTLLEDLAESARNHWIGLADAEFFTTKRDYIHGIQPVTTQAGQATISLVGVLPNLLENGMSERDLHETLLGPNVPISPPGEYGKHLFIRPGGQVGYYRSIPFRHGTPDSGGAVGAPMGYAYRNSEAVADWKKLGEKVYGAAKKLKPTKGMPGGGVAYGGRLQAGLAPLLKPHHKSDIYAGMVKEAKTYVKATQSQYVTFRMISTGSEGWIRPATEGRKLVQKVSEFTARLAPQAFAAYVSALK